MTAAPMHIRDIFQAHPTTFSFEFFPPKTDEASEELFANIAQLQVLQPSFVSVTYGAGGSTRERTHDLIVRIQQETSLTAVSHLTCVCHTRDELAAILDRYAASGIENILALGGDPPRNLPNYDRARDAFQYADGLVAFIRNHPNVPDSRGFGVGVAGFPEGHPTTPNRLKETRLPEAQGGRRRRLHLHPALLQQRRLLRLPRALRAGRHPRADRRGDHADHLQDGHDPDGRPGAGRAVPARLLRAIDRCGDDPEAVSRVGIHWATEQCRDLLDNNVRGLHFYTLNRSDATRRIYEYLGVKDSLALRVR